MPVINTSNPFDDAAGAVGGYLQARTAAQQAAQQLALQQAAAARQAKMDDANLAMKNQQMDLDKKRFDADQANTAYDHQRDDREDALKAKAEADRELDKAREDAMKAAQLQYQRTKDARAYQVSLLKINVAHQDAQARIRAEKDVANIHAAATMGAAQIHASAAVEAASIGAASRHEDAMLRESGLDRRATASNKIREEAIAARNKTKLGNDLAGKQLSGRLNTIFSKSNMSPKASLTIQSLVQNKGTSYPKLVEVLKDVKASPAGKYPISPDDAEAALSALQEDE